MPVTVINDYPSITTTDQTALRKVLRRERRVEFAWENLRYFDLLRWHQFENAFGHNMYGFTRTANRAKEYFAAGNWFWPETPMLFLKARPTKRVPQVGDRAPTPTLLNKC